MSAALDLKHTTARSLRDAGYRAQRTGMAAVSGLLMRAVHALMKPGRGAPPADQAKALQRRFRALLDGDLRAVDAGYYPSSLIFRTGLREYLKVLPEGLLDLPRVLRRARTRRYAELPAGVDLARFPRYYRRTFHWQSDGWLSARSARIYDPAVELLFGGAADIMRRAIVPDLADAVRDREAPRLLDVACGTGRFLRLLGDLLPGARLEGLELSPHYAEHARALTAGVGAVITEGNAEAMPYDDGAFDAISCVFLFHELPREAREHVAAELFRVLSPGGTLAFLDSAQLVDASDIGWFLEGFPEVYHEPYFKTWLQSPVEELLAGAGFTVQATRPTFVAKAVIASKPAPAP